MNNMVDFQEKMDPTHRASLCRMLKTKQLPECLLKEYLKAKKMVDVVDGFLTVGELALIALAAGYDPDTGQFGLTLEETTEGIDANLQAKADKMAVEAPELDESDDKVIEDAVEQPVSGATGQAVEQPDAPQPVDPESVEKPVPEERQGAAKLWSPGMPVNVLQEEELKLGKIFAVHPGDVEEPVRLTISLEGGETITVNEDEVEAV